MAAESNHGSSGAILVVDDEATVRKLVSTILSTAGYEVFLADSGENALRVFAKRGSEITLLLTDVIAPGMSGPELSEQLSNIYMHLKVIYMSGYYDSVVVRRYVLERGFTLLTKPFSADQLLDAVQAAIGPATPAALSDQTGD
jgi:two-component system cell cycle sensor histidine kinase/response regulator CckA